MQEFDYRSGTSLLLQIHGIDVMLREFGDDEFCMPSHMPLGWLNLTGQQFEERGFAGAIRPDDRHP